jgi:hypothetical protein
MTDQWVPAPPQPPSPDPPANLQPANSWQTVTPCASANSPSIADGVIITGRPAVVSATPWQITVNDGQNPPNFSIDHLDGTGALIESPVFIDGSSGDVMLTHDPTQPLGAATKEYVDNTGVREAPADGTTYGRNNAAWTRLPTIIPEAPGTSQIFGRMNSVWTVVPIQTDAPSDGAAYARQNGAWSAAVTGGPYLPLAGGTITGSLTVNQVLTVQGANSLALNAAGGNQRAILGQTSTLTRWQLQLGDQTAEGLNNVGSNFSLSAYSNTASFLGNWLTIARADGSTTFNGSGVTIAGGLAVNGLLALASPNNLAIYGGSAGQVLSTNGSGVLSWATRLADAPSDGQFYTRQNAAWAVAPGGMTDAPSDGTAYARKSAAWAHLTHTDITDWTATLAGYLPLTGGSLSGNLTIASTAANGGLTIAPTTGSAALVLDRPSAAMNSLIDFQSAGVARWRLYSPTNEAETGGNAGSNFQLWRFSDTGVSLGQVLGINRATGAATFSGDLSAASIAAPQAIGDNRIINGDCRIDQRNNGVSGTATQTYTVDRWFYGANQTAKGTWQRNTGPAALAATGFPYFLQFTSSSAYTPLAGDFFMYYQPIEADMVSDFAFGTANAQPVTVSFWASASVAGTYGGSLKNSTQTRSYPFSFTLAANTWTKITVTIPGDTAGTWVMNGAAVSMFLSFDLGSGANFRAPANAWAAGNYVGVTGSVSVIAVNGASIQVTGVKLEIGSVATPFNRQTMAKSLADCQRYYEVCAAVWVGDGTASVNYTLSVPYAVEKRASPTLVSISQTGAANGNVGARSGSVSSTAPTRAANWAGVVAATGAARGFNDSFSASAEL